MKLKMTADEWAWALNTLKQLQKKQPSSRRHKIAYNATRWDLDDLYRAAREDACSNSGEIWDAIGFRTTEGKWPKVSPAVALWLSVRIQAAREFAELVLAQAASDEGPPQPTPPIEGLAAIKPLLLEYWYELFVDRWLAVNLRDYVYQESYKLSADDEAYFSAWLRDVEAGKYIEERKQ